MWKSSFHVAQTDLGFLYGLKGRTSRFVIKNNLRGEKIRVLFANETSITPIEIAGAAIEKIEGNEVVSKIVIPLTFSGKSKLTLRYGESCYCDTVSMMLVPGDNLALRICVLGKGYSGNVIGNYAQKSTRGNHCSEPDFPTDLSLPFIYRIAKLPYEAPILSFKSLEVDTDEQVCVLSAIGDSITAGAIWTTPLADLLYKMFPGEVSLGNAGIAGNRLLKDQPKGWGKSFGVAGVNRFEKDVLSVAGLSHVIFALGTNDIGYPGNIEKKAQMPTVEEFIDAYGKLVSTCRERNIRTIYMPIFPRDDNFQSETLENLRRKINAELPKTGLFDYCIEVEAALEDPNRRGCREEYVNTDKLHLNVTGGEVVAKQIDILKLLGRK